MISQDLDWTNFTFSSRPIQATTVGPEKDEELKAYLKQYGEFSLESIPSIEREAINEQNDVLNRSSQTFGIHKSATHYLHLPVLLYLHPKPEGYKYSTFQQMQLVDYDRLTQVTNDLVTKYSPRSIEMNQVFTDTTTCELSLEIFEMNNVNRALEDLENQFRALGYRIEREPVPGTNGSYNLIAEKTPSDTVNHPSVIEIVSPLDSARSSPGASQSALSTAGVLEIATALKNYPNRHPWRFIILVNEIPNLAGSKAHLKKTIGQPFKIALFMEGIGWSESEPEFMNCTFDTLDLPYTLQVSNTFDWVRKLYGIGINWRRCTDPDVQTGVTRYWKAGLPAVLSVGGYPYQDPNLNACSDNMGNVDIYNGYLTIQQNVGVLLTLDQEP